jgi:hypothetical protein
LREIGYRALLHERASFTAGSPAMADASMPTRYSGLFTQGGNMQILSDDDIHAVAGGMVPLVAALVFTVANAGNFRDFMTGFFEGLED